LLTQNNEDVKVVQEFLRHAHSPPDGKSYAYGYVRRLSELYTVDGLR